MDSYETVSVRAAAGRKALMSSKRPTPQPEVDEIIATMGRDGFSPHLLAVDDGVVWLVFRKPGRLDPAGVE
jgi:hypothetical protein